MSDSPRPANADTEVEVQLLDPTFGRPLKSWTFQNRAQITIGRAPDQDVEISDPYVSRNHARLGCRHDQWVLVSLGRNGVVVANQLIAEYPVSGDVSFRLGMEGPTMRFRAVAEKAEVRATISFDTLPGPVFQLDRRRLQDAVDEIADGDYFQNLQQRAKQLRGQR